MKFIAQLCLALVLLSGTASCDKKELPISAEAPDFTLQDQNGNAVSLESLRGKTVVLEWTNPDCPFVRRLYEEGAIQNVASKYAEKDVEWLSINSTKYMDAENNKKWSAEKSLGWKVLSDKSGEIGKLYGAKTTPHVFVLDKEGKLIYQGAFDDDPHGSKSERVNYVSAALEESLAGAPVSTKKTKPYGCSVKYAG